MSKPINVLLALCVVAATALAQPAPDALEPGRELTRAFYAGDLEPVAAALSPEVDEIVGGEEGLSLFREQLLQQFGEEVTVLSETVEELEGMSVYTRVARFANYGGPLVIQWALEPDSTIAGFRVEVLEPSGEAESRYLDHTTSVDLRLPFDGEWTVFWGGRSVEQNYHAAHLDQRFALDLVVVRGGSTYNGDGGRNSDYHCFGLPVLAPGDGVVVAALGTVPDNVPGEFDDVDPLGNHVIIDHGTGEFSFLAHLREGSVAVEPGQRVSAGEVVGECGNSGRSSEAHLHYHLQDSPDLGAGEGMPAQFQAYLADGELVERGEPVQGQVVAPAGPR